MNNQFTALTTGLFLLFSTTFFAQTLIINEVSNGEAGNEEYVELVVMDDNVTYNCGDTEPPCIDIRGWIFDDNSGYHGTDGAADGCLRFSFDPLWECVPVGTIIVLYNDAEYNTSLIPSPDVSMADGNCTILAPISDVNLFESNTTTPGDVACSYPSTGWTAGGNWNNVLLRNGGDCARIVDLSGCEVFSLCWGDNDQNTLIYFEDGIEPGAGTASNTVFYFTNGDPQDQVNWVIGCADEPNCGVQDQTPGYPNNSENATYIAQFNNGCQAIAPIVATASVDQDAMCGCTGQATASGTGSIPGYTYEWLDADENSIGQNSSTATNLCEGSYFVIVTSSIGCSDTTEVTLSSVASPIAEFTYSVNGTEVTFTNTSSNATDYNWNFGNGEFSTTTSNSFTISYDEGGTYLVLLEAINGGCNDIYSLEINLQEPITPVIHVPNVFTPNGDGTNEEFTIQTQYISSIEGIILNRWGNVIATFNELDYDWDGVISGEKAPAGVYFVKYKAHGLDGNNYEGHTFFQLIR